MNKFCRFIAVIALFGFLGCSKQIDLDPSMLIGKYTANHKYGLDTLEINSDGTYNYYFKSNDGTELINSNQWEFEILDNEPWITFEKFIFGMPRPGTKKPGFWVVEVEKSWTWKSIRLYIDLDLHYYYEKQSP